MSTTVGNGLTVDGTVKASQATQAGEAVVLGDDGLIPANLVASGGGKVETPYFYADDGYTYFESLIPDSEKSTTYSYTVGRRNTFGTDVIDGSTKYPATILPGYGAVATNLYILGTRSSSSSSLYRHVLDTARTQLLLNEHIRTNLRGDFIITLLCTQIGTTTYTYGGPSKIDVTISDEGITVNSGQFVGYKTTALTSGNVYIKVSGIELKSLPEWC